VSTAILRDADGEVIGGVETFRDLSQVEDLRRELEGRYTFSDIIGRSPAMQALFELLPVVAESDSSVLIHGASGTGKELVARAIHDLSSRGSGRFVAINCGALPDTLLESELFGHKAGSFTDARKDKPGRFAVADGGTILLDEIGDISPAM
jgi:transcriptional regulator with PAS, ATPase and Fis domain